VFCKNNCLPIEIEKRTRNMKTNFFQLLLLSAFLAIEFTAEKVNAYNIYIYTS
jgi:hypothetical protein